MKPISWPAAAVAALIGAAAALAMNALASAPTTTVRDPAAAPSGPRGLSAQPADAAESAAVAEALAAFSDQLTRLSSRVEQLERQPAHDARVELSAPRERDAAAQVSARSSSVAPDDLQASVATALDNLRVQERAKAEAERQERDLQRIEERLTRLNERLALSPDQTNLMRALMLAQERERDELERMREQGAEREQRRLAAEEAERRRNVELTRILTPEQLAGLRELESSRNEDRGRGRRGNAGGASNGAGGARARRGS